MEIVSDVLPPAPRGIVVLIEDDRDIGASLVEMIQQETPYHALLATTVHQAMQMFRHITPCLLIVDYHLPVIDGLRFYDIFRAITEFKTIPVLMMTADPAAIRQAAAERGLPLIVKPFQFNRFLKEITHSLSEHSLIADSSENARP